jgi:hypothetical protein
MASVKLKQLVGRRPTRGGGSQLVKHPTDEIYYDDQLVGQIARHANPTLCLYYPQNTAMTDEILRAVIEARAADPDGKNWLPNGKSISPPTDGQVQEAVDTILEDVAAEEEEVEDETEE